MYFICTYALSETDCFDGHLRGKTRCSRSWGLEKIAGEKRRIGADVGSICWPANIGPGLRLGDGASEDFRERPGDDPQDIRHTNRPPQLLGNGRNRHILDATWNDGLEKG